MQPALARSREPRCYLLGVADRFRCTAVINEFKILWWNNPNATNQTLTIDMFSLTGVLLGTTQPFTYTIPAPSTYQVVTVTTPIPFTGPFYGMLHYNNFSGLTHWVGYDQTAGQGGTFDLGYAYDGATFTKWNNYAGAGTGTFCIQACGLVNSDNGGFVPVTYGGELPAQGTVAAATGILSRSPEGATAPAATVPPTPEADNLLVGYRSDRVQCVPPRRQLRTVCSGCRFLKHLCLQPRPGHLLLRRESVL